jgi:hypothetical protein
MMNPGIEFNFTGRASSREKGTELFDHRQRRQFGVLGASDVELALHFAE